MLPISPKVDPCSPRLMQSIISLSAKTAEAGMTPPESALPKSRYQVSHFRNQLLTFFQFFLDQFEPRQQ